MNWNELASKIEQMTIKEREQEVRFLEPYDEPAGHPVDLVCAEDIFTADQEENNDMDEPFVAEGEWMLQ